jgi:hypothetical protein
MLPRWARNSERTRRSRDRDKDRKPDLRPRRKPTTTSPSRRASTTSTKRRSKITDRGTAKAGTENCVYPGNPRTVRRLRGMRIQRTSLKVKAKEGKRIMLMVLGKAKMGARGK